jgi:3'-phosphoadenosine 5'-phosphosulfate sulfotransferase (PAPS reductase)/FAD synthetase
MSLSNKFKTIVSTTLAFRQFPSHETFVAGLSELIDSYLVYMKIANIHVNTDSEFKEAYEWAWRFINERPGYEIMTGNLNIEPVHKGVWIRRECDQNNVDSLKPSIGVVWV